MVSKLFLNLIQSLRNNNHNHATSTYWILQKKKRDGTLPSSIASSAQAVILPADISPRETEGSVTQRARSTPRPQSQLATHVNGSVTAREGSSRGRFTGTRSHSVNPSPHKRPASSVGYVRSTRDTSDEFSKLSMTGTTRTTDHSPRAFFVREKGDSEFFSVGRVQVHQSRPSSSAAQRTTSPRSPLAATGSTPDRFIVILSGGGGSKIG